MVTEPPKYEKVGFGIPSICMYVYVCALRQYLNGFTDFVRYSVFKSLFIVSQFSMKLNVPSAEKGAFQLGPKLQNDDVSHRVTKNFIEFQQYMETITQNISA
jgi:hypothetical protein